VVRVPERLVVSPPMPGVQPALCLLVWALGLSLCFELPPLATGACTLALLLARFLRSASEPRWRAPERLTPDALPAWAGRAKPVQTGQGDHADRSACCLGTGGVWEPRHSVALHEAASPACGLARTPGRDPDAPRLSVSGELLARNVLALGSPGSGKSSLLVLLAWQAQRRGEALIVVDPKGSRAMQALLSSGARAAGRPFLAVLPARPADSARYDPLQHCASAGELATRLCSLIAGEQQDPFRDFCWGVLATLAEALWVGGERPTLGRLRALLPEAGSGLLAAWPPRGVGIDPARDAAARRSLETLASHDRGHYRKMIAALLPVMELLSAGPLGTVLQSAATAAADFGSGDGSAGGDRATCSAGVEPGAEVRPIFDVESCRRQASTVYLGLDALGQPRLARALGVLVCADIAAEAARRVSEPVPPRALHLMVDEAGEVASEALLQLLGKGREARVQLLIAVQTLADLEWRLGSAAAARVAEGNAGAWFLFRQLDALSRQESEARLGRIALERPSRSQSRSTAASPGRHTHAESLAVGASREFLPRIPEASFAALRDLECLAALPDGQLLHLRLPALQPSLSLTDSGDDRAADQPRVRQAASR
jgi:conjugal transfer pilus assembly protein TraD